MKKKYYLFTAVFFALLLTACGSEVLERPNIMWIVVEDMSSHFGYQGEVLVSTPHIDQLAKEGVVYQNAYVSAPVCSASRSAFITGMYQTSIGAHNHRSSRGIEKIVLPEGIKTIPELFQDAGYYTSNGQENLNKKGKEDYNFVHSKSIYNDSDWHGKAEGQPFFAQVQLRGGKLRNVPKWYAEVLDSLKGKVVNPHDVKLPPYYPDCEVFRKDWAEYLTSISFTDIEVGNVIADLKEAGELDNTVIFFITDHGISQARGKQFLYDEGTHIPFIVWAPGRLKAGIKDELINHIDMSATSLELAGIAIPDYIEGRSLVSDNHHERKYIVCARDRCDETVDHIRSIREGNFKYIKNYLPQRPYLQPCAYKDHKPFMPELKSMAARGELNAAQKLVTASIRPVEELYDLSKDPFEINNLALEITYESKLVQMRKILTDWEYETGDKGLIPESEAMYDSDMTAYLNAIRRGKEKEQATIIEDNIAVMKQWAKEGK